MARHFLSRLPYFYSPVLYASGTVINHLSRESHPATLVQRRDRHSLKGRVPPPTGIIAQPPERGYRQRHLAPRVLLVFQPVWDGAEVSRLYYYRQV
jgi:hypothetical protein